MNNSLEVFKEEVLERIQRSGSETEIEQVRVETLGRKGRLTLLLRGLKDLSADERPRVGEQLNQMRQLFEENFATRLRQVKEQEKKKTLQEEEIDVTLPGTRWERGRNDRCFLGHGFRNRSRSGY
jgi:phenylalanyl-tRNA synthetase alpha chain